MNFYSPLHSTGPDATEVPLLRLAADEAVPARTFGLYGWGTPDHTVDAGPLEGALTALASLAESGEDATGEEPAVEMAQSSQWPTVPSDIAGLGL